MEQKNGKTSEAKPPPQSKRPAWFRYLFNFRFFSDEHPKISPHAVVDPSAEIADDVEIGPFCVVGPGVKIGPGCRLLNSVTIVGDTTVGRDNIFFPNSVIGTAPQDKKYKGAPTRLEIGNGNAFREACTIHVGTEKGGGVTTIGDNNLFMVNSHVGHDARIGSHCVISNNVMIAGHVLVGDGVAMMGGVGVHHFVTIGMYAYVGGYARIHHDVPPFVKVDGADQVRGLNKVGLTRSNMFSAEDVAELDAVCRRLFLRRKPFALAMAEYEPHLNNGDGLNPHVKFMLEFLRRRNQGRHGRFQESLRERGPQALTEAAAFLTGPHMPGSAVAAPAVPVPAEATDLSAGSGAPVSVGASANGDSDSESHA
jgi:UDP-N-acetylglucosamine acyltransferase